MSLIGHNGGPPLTIEEMVVAAAAAVRPPERLSVSESASRRWLNNPGSYVGPWKNEKTPYLVEPMDEMESLNLTGIVFVGPARTGKSDMFFNWLNHVAITDPSDMMAVHMTQNTARDWSQGDLNKAFFNGGNKNAPTEIGKRLVPGKQNDNVFDKKFLSGMRLLIKWPTITELSGKTVRRLWINDYDRGDEVVDKEGLKWDLTKKRAFTYKRFGMCVAESSPGRDIVDPNWMPSSPHEAPPTSSDKQPGGIMALYNRGDRRRWYWRCPQCGGAFEPDFELFDYPDSADPHEAAGAVVMACPHNGCVLTPDMQFDLNLGGKWIKDGQLWLPDGTVAGQARRSDIGSFWLKGPAAAFGTWGDLVVKYLTALKEYEANGSEEGLRGTITLDQGKPYKPKAADSARLPEQLKDRAEDWGGAEDAPVVPADTRFLIATVDVQAGSRSGFVVHVHGFGPGGDTFIVDMFRIRSSDRPDPEDTTAKAVCDPAGYKEDWRLLVPRVMDLTYPLADGSGRRMSIKLTGCDTGGREGVTANAYAFWRWLRHEHTGDQWKRFQLLKGEPSRTAPRTMLRFPDSSQKGAQAIARGDAGITSAGTGSTRISSSTCSSTSGCRGQARSTPSSSTT